MVRGLCKNRCSSQLGVKYYFNPLQNRTVKQSLLGSLGFLRLPTGSWSFVIFWRCGWVDLTEVIFFFLHSFLVYKNGLYHKGGALEFGSEI
jgi:hypothetical protein